MTTDNTEKLAAKLIEAGAYEEAYRLLLPLAEQDSEYALLTLGWICDTGAAGDPDKDAAQKYYEQAAAKGSARAHHYLGWLLWEKGEEVRAWAYFEAGAQRGSEECKSAVAQVKDAYVEQLAALAIEEEEYREAIGLLLPLVERKSKYALLTLGWIAEEGLADTPDTQAALAYYEEAADGGTALAYFYLGLLQLKIGEQAEARSAFEAGAQRGSDECRSILARLDLEDVERNAADAIEAKDYKKAVGLLTPLAKSDSEYALLILGYMCQAGLVGDSDLEAARSYYERAAAAGSGSACHYLGQLLMDAGEESQARSTFATGAERGDGASMSSLGQMMVQGAGGLPDVGAGFVLLELAATKGSTSAQSALLRLKRRQSKSTFDREAGGISPPAFTPESSILNTGIAGIDARRWKSPVDRRRKTNALRYRPTGRS